MVQVVLVPLLTIASTLGVSSLILLLSVEEVNGGTPWSKTPFWTAFILGPLGLYAIYYYLKIFRSISVDNRGITVSNIFNSIFYPWSDVNSIRLTGKEPERFLGLSMPSEALSIAMNSGERRVLFSKYYRNFPIILQGLQFIKKQLKNNQKPQLNGFEYKILDAPDIQNLDMLTKYDNNHWLSFNGIAIYGFTALMSYLVFTADRPIYPGGLFLLGFTSLFWIGLGYQLHYFLLDNRYLVVKNHIWLLRTHTYRLSDINEIVFERPYRMSTSMRVNTKDFRTRLYPAGSLKTTTWQLLMEELRKHNVNVRNEAIYEDPVRKGSQLNAAEAKEKQPDDCQK